MLVTFRGERVKEVESNCWILNSVKILYLGAFFGLRSQNNFKRDHLFMRTPQATFDISERSRALSLNLISFS